MTACDVPFPIFEYTLDFIRCEHPVEELNAEIITQTKTCTKCQETKPIAEFYKHERGRLGRSSRCKSCLHQMRADYRDANLSVVQEQRRRYREKNRQAISESNRIYHQENPHVAWETSYRFRVRKYGHDPVVVSFTRDELIERWGDACAHCGGEFQEIDHYPIPVKDGGPHTLANCRPTCSGCNQESWRDSPNSGHPHPTHGGQQ